MTNNKLIQELQNRGLVAKITNPEELAVLLKQNSISLYCGFDPTADSLHLGHLIPLLCLKRFQMVGHKPIVVIGGATSLIGDPSFKSVERKLNAKEAVWEWTDKVQGQIELFLDFDCGKNTAIITNNYYWFSDMNILTFLRDIGKHFSVNQMINRDAVRQRLNRDDQGISFTEFSYSLLQSYDYAYLNKKYGVKLQIGGSDQWGNIISGINLTRCLHKNRVFGLTLPLFTKLDGTKFGKTEEDTLWLDPKKTSPYKFYQFWINIPDTDVYRFLKFFTFIDIEEIEALEEQDKNRNKALDAKRTLGEHLVRLIHGEKGLFSAKRITDSLFNENLCNLNQSDFEQLSQDGMPTIEMKKGASLVHALVASNLHPSRCQARNAIATNAIVINGKRQSDPRYIFSERDLLFGRYTLLRRGKKSHILIRWK